MREIVLDTETTGLDPLQGHRLVEVGCIELLNRIPTGATFHSYLNPEREVPAEAFAIHGLATDFLQDKPRFADSRRRVPHLHRRRAAGDPQCQLRSRLPHCRAQARGASADRARAAGRYAAAGAPQASGGTEPARRSVRALWHRQFAAHQARRAARRRDPGRSLSGTDRRAPGAARPRRERRAPQQRARRRRSAARAQPWHWRRASAMPIARHTANSSRRWARMRYGGIIWPDGA